MSAADRLANALTDRYRIERELGQGGMATVYLAQDLRHDRRVALKVLRPDLAAVIGAERFLQEIRTTANLQHPHILPLHDSGQVDGTVFYVMPYVEGESLRDRISRDKQLPVDQALQVAREVADALGYAHERGVIHRDIKPENILLQRGHALVADFGIALAASRTGGSRMTETGMSLGTPHYMSPEQAMGERDLDLRTDIYALGCVLYEMLVGEPPFTGATAQQIVAKVLTDPPRPLTEQRRTIPSNVDAAVRQALEKLPADRFGSTAEFARALGDAGFMGTSAAIRPVPRTVRTNQVARLVPWAIASASLAVAVWLGLKDRSRSDAVEPIFASIDLENTGISGTGSDNFTLSPDGRQLALTVEQGTVGLAIRSLDSVGIRLLARTRGANHPFWSPDSKSVGYFTEDSLKVVEVASGSVRALCETPGGSQGGTWAADGTILFSAQQLGLLRTRAPGGACENWMPRARDDLRARALRPYFFPDGRHFIATGDQDVWLGDLGTDSLVRLGDLTRAEAVLAPPDWVLLRGTNGLMAQRVDLGNKRFSGEPIRILSQPVNPRGHTAVAVSSNGVLVRSAPATFDSAGPSYEGVGVVERGSGVLRRLGIGTGTWRDPRVSRDGRRLVLGGWNIQTFDLASGRWVRVAGPVETGVAVSSRPIWSPRDSAIVFQQAGAPPEIHAVSMASGTVRSLLQARGGGPADVSPDGNRIALESFLGRVHEWDLLKDTVVRLFEAPGPVTGLRYAPGGGWLAYMVGSGGGTSDVFVRRYPAIGDPVRVSTGGGRHPRWRADGSELFYQEPSGAVVAVTVPRMGAGFGPARTVVPASVFSDWHGDEFDVSPDGQRFYFLIRPRVRSLGLILNWHGLLQRPGR